VEEEYDKFGQLSKVSQWLDRTTQLTWYRTSSKNNL
jgi:hypothetical protein